MLFFCNTTGAAAARIAITAGAFVELVVSGRTPWDGESLQGRRQTRRCHDLNEDPRWTRSVRSGTIENDNIIAIPLSDSERRKIVNSRRDSGELFWQASAGRADILARSWFLEPTTQLDALVEASRLHRVVVLTGKAGAGKSSLATALARPEIAGGRVPDGFVHAIAMLESDTIPASLGDDLERQLRGSVPGFAEALAEFRRCVPLPEREKLDALARKVLEPLTYLVQKPDLRIVLDGFDRLSELTRDAVSEAVAAWSENLRVVISARPETPGLPPGFILDHGLTARDALDRYLTSRQVPASARPAILDRAGGHWLVTRLLADLILNDPAIDLAQLPDTVNEIYPKLLDQARARGASNPNFLDVLGLLAVAGEGPVLPLSLLAQACQALGGPEGSDGVREVLGRLGGLVVRRDAGTTEEHAGLFHATLAEYLLDPSASGAGFPLDARAMHEAMIQAIDALAATAKHDRGDPVHRYAMLREADHLWALGNAERTLASLRRRELPDARENLRRWLEWLRRFRERFDEDEPHILDLRGAIARWTNRSGNTPEALRLCAELLPEQERALGRDHPITLTTRGRIAYFTAELGDARGALRLFAELLSDQERALGSDHADSLKNRAYIAHWTGNLGDGREALRLFTELLPDAERVLGHDHADTLWIRNSIAYGTGRMGDAREALRLHTELLPDQERVLGRDHADTLNTRFDIAYFTGELGEACEASRLFADLLADQERILGHDDRCTLRTRFSIASSSGDMGEMLEASRQLHELLPDSGKKLDFDNLTARLTFISRMIVAASTAHAGDLREALRLFAELLADQERELGRDDELTLQTRSAIGFATHQLGHAREALRLLAELLPDQERVLGHDHADTLETRGLAAVWTRDMGDAREALRLFTELLPDQERVLGHDHADTLRIRSNVAYCTGETGDAREALRLFTELLPDQERVLGHEHKDALYTRGQIAWWSAALGEMRRAAASVHQTAERSGAAAGPRPQRRALHSRQHRDVVRRIGQAEARAAATHGAAARPRAGTGALR